MSEIGAAADRPELDPLEAARYATQDALFCAQLSLGRVSVSELSAAERYSALVHIQSCGERHDPLPGVTVYSEDIASRL